jgi:hypothetical protein
MVDEGDYAEVLWEYVDRAAAGPQADSEEAKHAGSYRDGLGCS